MSMSTPTAGPFVRTSPAGHGQRGKADQHHRDGRHRLDATRMLPPLRLGLTQPTIATDAAAGWMVQPYRTIQQHGSHWIPSSGRRGWPAFPGPARHRLDRRSPRCNQSNPARSLQTEQANGFTAPGETLMGPAEIRADRLAIRFCVGRHLIIQAIQWDPSRSVWID
jgi:hypothetical protein